MLHPESSKGTKVLRDNVRKHFAGGTLCIYVLEHQKNIDYQIHIFDYHDYENCDMFHTELKQVFSFLKYSSNKEKLRNMIAKNWEDYYNISDETYEMIAMLADARELLDIKKKYRNEDLGGMNMCKALEDIKLEGREEGREEGLKAFIVDYVEEGFSKEKILMKLQKRFHLSESQARMYFERFAPVAVV